MNTITFSFLMLLHVALLAASANGLPAAQPAQEENVKATSISYPADQKFLVPQKHRYHQTLTKRPQDANAIESLKWLMKEAEAYHTTVSLHINMFDAYEDSPLGDEYITKDIIAKNVVTSESVDFLRETACEGYQAMAWRFNRGGKRYYLQWPASYYCGGRDDSEWGKLFGSSMHGGDIVRKDPESLRGFKEQFCLKTAVWYCLNRLQRLQVLDGKEYTSVVFSDKSGRNSPEVRGGRGRMLCTGYPKATLPWSKTPMFGSRRSGWEPGTCWLTVRMGMKTDRGPFRKTGGMQRKRHFTGSRTKAERNPEW